MGKFILPVILITISGFVFLQNKKPIEDRPIAFSDPWGWLVYIPTSTVGVYLLLRIGIVETIIGWFASLFIANIFSGIFERAMNK